MNKIFLLLLSLSSIMAADKPNIVLILSDDQAWNDYSMMGHSGCMDSVERFGNSAQKRSPSGHA